MAAGAGRLSDSDQTIQARQPWASWCDGVLAKAETARGPVSRGTDTDEHRYAPSDPLTTLREYRALAPWGLRDLAALAGGILDASGVVPVNAAARARPSERTIRFYVARGLVSPPDGRGTAAVYSYRHLLQVLAIKLRQMEGATLESMVKEFAGLTGDLIERRAASALGPGLPPPGQLPLLRTPGPAAEGWDGRSWPGWRRSKGSSAASSSCRRIAVAPGWKC